MRSRVPKDEDFTEENLVGKAIVDPNGDIIAKCIGLIEDEKKKIKMRITIKTELGSDFEVEEKIPVNLIKQIGSVILLKKSFEIQPIATEDIVTFDMEEEEEKGVKTIETDSKKVKEEPQREKEGNNN